METLIRISEALRRIVEAVGQLAKWLVVPLVLITIWDVVTRKFLTVQLFVSSIFGDVLNSTKLQEMEWHLHTALFALCLGFGYIRNAHVRIDLVAEGRSPRWRAWVEFLGCILFLLPYTALVIFFAYDFVLSSYLQGEVSASMIGIPHRWIIKGVLMLGMILALLAGVSIMLRYFVVLFGSARAEDAPFEQKPPATEPVVET